MERQREREALTLDARPSFMSGRRVYETLATRDGSAEADMRARRPRATTGLAIRLAACLLAAVWLIALAVASSISSRRDISRVGTGLA